MTTQPTLPYVKGSETSQAAAESMEPHAPTIRHRVFRYILSRGDHGATDDEIEGALGLKHQTASARRRELEKDYGAVRLETLGDGTPRKRRTGSGRMAGVYVAIEGVNIDNPRGTDPKVPGQTRSKRVHIHLTRAEFAALSEEAASAGVPVGAMARALMVHGYQFRKGLHAAGVML